MESFQDINIFAKPIIVAALQTALVVESDESSVRVWFPFSNGYKDRILIIDGFELRLLRSLSDLEDEDCDILKCSRTRLLAKNMAGGEERIENRETVDKYTHGVAKHWKYLADCLWSMKISGKWDTEYLEFTPARVRAREDGRVFPDLNYKKGH